MLSAFMVLNKGQKIPWQNQKFLFLAIAFSRFISLKRKYQNLRPNSTTDKDVLRRNVFELFLCVF